MNFYESQDNARRLTSRLVFLFATAVFLLIVAIYTVVVVLFRPGEPVDPTGAGGSVLWNPGLFAFVTLVTLFIVGAGSAWKTAQLSGGGSVVAELLGGREVSTMTTDPAERRLLNTVEEMAIASGVPVPTVYLLERERGINAFAAGFTQSDAVIGVTRGALDLLDRNELQGVIAHEFSHVLNGDMRLNLRLMGIVHGILIIGLIGYWVLRAGGRSRGSSRKGGGGAIVLLGLALFVLGYIGVFFGKLIKSAVSRQREYLADASAVQFTRYPDGLAGALKKIGGLGKGSRVDSSHAEEASHLFFSNAVSSGLVRLMSTHPPLETRIRRIDPAFDGNFPRIEPAVVQEAVSGQEAARAASSQERLGKILRPAVMGGAAAMGSAGGALGGAAAAGVAAAVASEAPTTMDDLVGTLSEQHIAYAEALVASLPEQLREAVHEPVGAEAVVYALLLDRDGAARAAQKAAIAPSLEPVVGSEVEKLQRLVDASPPEARLPLIDLAVPTLRKLSQSQYRALRENVRKLVEADRKIELFEYALQRVLFRHVTPHFATVRQPAVQYYSLAQLSDESSVVLSALARFGHTDEEDAGEAFRAGAEELVRAERGPSELRFLAPADCRLPHFDAALEKLAATAPQLKKHLVRACAATVAIDRKITVGEGETLRAVADAIDVPMPPFLPGQAVRV